MNTDFHHITLPSNLAVGSSTMPQHRTDIVETGSGFEFRNGIWATPRRLYRLAAGARPLADAEALQDFFNARHGRLYGFLWHDALDYRASNQPLIALDDTRTLFGLQKRYGDFTRDITKAVANSISMRANNRPLSSSRYQLMAESGQVRLATALGENVPITASFKFNVPVRFDSDTLEITRLSPQAAHIAAITLSEIKLTHPIT